MITKTVPAAHLDPNQRRIRDQANVDREPTLRAGIFPPHEHVIQAKLTNERTGSRNFRSEEFRVSRQFTNRWRIEVAAIDRIDEGEEIADSPFAGERFRLNVTASVRGDTNDAIVQRTLSGTNRISEPGRALRMRRPCWGSAIRRRMPRYA